MEKIKIGIIGCGGIANGKHMPAIRKLDDVEMTAFCDIIPERAQKAAEEYGTSDAKVYTDYKELLKDERINNVRILTPNKWHAVMSIEALYAGKHVMCEKPMAINYREAQEMLKAQKETGKLLTIGYQHKFDPDVVYAKQEALKNTFGDIYYAKANVIRRRGVPTWGVFTQKAEQGGGSLIVNANYNNGIGCKNDVEIKNGKVTVSAVNNAVKGNDSVTVCGDAEVVIEAADDGLKADTIDRPDKGFVKVTENAKVTVSCTDDAIQATQNVTVTSGATVTIKSASQAVNCDGTVNVDNGCIVNQTP